MVDFKIKKSQNISLLLQNGTPITFFFYHVEKLTYFWKFTFFSNMKISDGFNVWLNCTLTEKGGSLVWST